MSRGRTLGWCWHWFSGCENIKSGVTFHTESSFHMKISGLGGICHMSDVTDVKISGRGHISSPGHCRPRASREQEKSWEPGDWELGRFLRVCEHFLVWEHFSEKILASMWTFPRWSPLITRENNVTMMSERWMQGVALQCALLSILCKSCPTILSLIYQLFAMCICANQSRKQYGPVAQTGNYTIYFRSIAVLKNLLECCTLC